MEGTSPRNVHYSIIITTTKFSSSATIKITLKKNKNEELKRDERGQVFDSINYVKDYNSEIFAKLSFLLIFINNISMLKRSRSMEFDSDHFKSAGEGDPGENAQIKKICNSPERSNSDEKSPSERDGSSPDNNRYRRLLGESAHVTQSKSIFSHENSIVYGNPKDDIKNIENPSTSEASREMSPFDNNPTSVLDLSCKGKAEEEKPPPTPQNPQTDLSTYQNYPRSNYDSSSFNRSNLEIKLVNTKKPTINEQLQIAKIQQQQRRSIQQQQKMLQQMRKSMDPSKPGSRSSSHHTNNVDKKHSGSNHDQNDLDNVARMKEEYHPPPIPGAHFPPPQYPYFNPAHMKELPDGHPILPLLDPVYFSALYNASGFLPPSSPSIAAEFIGTLQDALPKLPMMFPSTSSYNSFLLPQKSNENQN